MFLLLALIKTVSLTSCVKVSSRAKRGGFPSSSIPLLAPCVCLWERTLQSSDKQALVTWSRSDKWWHTTIWWTEAWLSLNFSLWLFSPSDSLVHLPRKRPTENGFNTHRRIDIVIKMRVLNNAHLRHPNRRSFKTLFYPPTKKMRWAARTFFTPLERERVLYTFLHCSHV